MVSSSSSISSAIHRREVFILSPPRDAPGPNDASELADALDASRGMGGGC